ncbi:MAG: deoxyribose-phosphate aldolase [Bacteroidota bacterium]|nr:deoxyribose-phosphate aldolase [Bacteroidota bacterium]MDP4244580.1 deoxyribose-phosphate aldolase [Bacteroidota bacterium]MDP4253146.1 deoxyribose-phosphate aldolase [Bacteroidota bacterium]MDP4257592.1 deoxyribose-phosphate aldolase [Bacteroidota bacterium]
MQIASYIDHTVLKPTTNHIEIKKICAEALQYHFAAVCIPPSMVRLAKSHVAGGSVSTATVIGFPFGYSVTKAKLAEIEQAIDEGADELDTVIDLTALKSGEWNELEREMEAIAEAVHRRGKLLKVIIESGILNDAEIIRCCEIYGRIGVDFLKTSTGYAEKGASVNAVRLMRQHLPASIRIKASGGIRSYVFARELIEAGADRLGASAGVDLVREEAAMERTGLEK